MQANCFSFVILFMRVLLINANRFKQPWPVIPYGLCCVATVLKKQGYDVDVLDLCFSNNPKKDIQKSIKKHSPQCVGVSIRNIDNAAAYQTHFLLDDTKKNVMDPLKLLYHGPIVIGGPAVGIAGAEMLDFFGIHYAIRGDGENAMIEFVRRIQQGVSPFGMNGLIYRDGNRIIESLQTDSVEDLNTLPLVRVQDYIDLKKYRRYDSPIQIQTKRGCPLTCAYCTYNRIEGHHYRLKNPEIIANEIEAIFLETGMDKFEFTDSTFNLPLSHAKATLRAIEKKKLPLRLRTMGLNPGQVDEELVQLLKATGFMDVDVGMEAGSDVTLAGLKKNYRKSDIEKTGKLLQAYKIPATWYLLLGAPGESKSTLRETFETVDRVSGSWDLINISIGIRVYKGAPLAQEVERNTPHFVSDHFLHPVYYRPEALSIEDIKILTCARALERPNYFMYDEDEKTPLVVLGVGCFLLQLFSPQTPVWRLHIIIRTIQKWMGVATLKTRYYLFSKRQKIRVLLI